MRWLDFALRGRDETGFCMKDDPNDKVIAGKVLAGDIPNVMKARRGWDADLF
jgi:hypothetical protein